MMSRKGLFSPFCSLENEMSEFASFMKDNSDLGREIFQSCNELVQYAESGQYRKFCQQSSALFQDTNQGDTATAAFHPPVIYFSSKALLAALFNHHWLIASFILDNGFPINQFGLPNILSTCIENKMNDEDAASLVDFLATKKFDFNQQIPPTYYAPLHHAIKARLVETTKRLISKEADVNIVADKDIMPLTLAMEMKSTETESRIEEIIDILMQHGAKMTWKKETTVKKTVNFSSAFLFSTSVAEEEEPQSSGFGTSHVTSTMISAKPPLQS